MLVTEKMVDKAYEAYSEKRHPSRTEPVSGLSGYYNHRKALKNVLNVIFRDYKIVKKQ